MWGHITSHSNTEYWASYFIAALWRFTTAMWTNQNQIVHGHSCQKKGEILLPTLHTQVSDHYAAFHHDSN